MENLDPICDAVQREISAAIDDGTKLPAALFRHAEHCPECTAFLEAWSGGLEAKLTSPLPPAGLELREKILAFPKRNAGARVAPAAHRFRRYISAAAAVVVLGICGHMLIDVRSTGDVAVSTETSPGEKELAAIKSDFRRGLAALREPTGAVQRVLSP